MIDVLEGTLGFIFDCDGTLLDTMPAWNRAEQQMEELAGRTFTPDELTELRAMPGDKIGAFFHDKFGIGASAADVDRMIDDALLDLYLTGAEALPGVPELLERAARAGIPCTVVTSSPRRYVDPGLRHAGIREHFLEICTTEELRTSKAEPHIYQHALKLMDAPADAAWGFDDALYAVQTMRDAVGLRTVGIFDCEQTAGSWELLQENATVAVRTLEELL